MGYSETFARRPSDDPCHRLRQYARCQHRVFGPASHRPIAQSGPPRAIGRPSRTGGSAHRAAINSHSSLFKAWRDTVKHEVSAWIPPVTSARSRPVDVFRTPWGHSQRLAVHDIRLRGIGHRSGPRRFLKRRRERGAGRGLRNVRHSSDTRALGNWPHCANLAMGVCAELNKLGQRREWRILAHIGQPPPALAE